MKSITIAIVALGAFLALVAITLGVSGVGTIAAVVGAIAGVTLVSGALVQHY